jgi:hypothetical protein
MAKAAGKITMRVLTIGLGIPLGILGRKAAHEAFNIVRPHAEGHSLTDPDASWGDVVGWAAVSSAAVVLADLLARRGAEEVWKFLLGTQPPPESGSKSRRRVKVRD